MFANEGARLVLADVNENGLNDTAGRISKADATVVIKKTDVVHLAGLQLDGPLVLAFLDGDVPEYAPSIVNAEALGLS